MRRVLILPLILLAGMLAACGGGDASSVQRGLPDFAPTATREVTAVPLILTPISTPNPLPGLPPLVDSQSSKMIAVAGDGLITVNPDSDSITLVDLTRGDSITEISVGDDPRRVAVTPDGSTALVTLRGENALAVIDLERRILTQTITVGHMPFGVVADDTRAYVSCFGSDEMVVVDLDAMQVLYRVPVMDAPAGLALSGDWLLSTHFYTGTVSVLNVQRTPFVVGTVNVEPDGEDSASIILSPDGRRAYLPQTRTGLALVSLQYMQDWFPVVGVLDVETMQGDRDARLTVSMLDDAANTPFDAAFADDGTLYVVLAGSDAVLAIDLTTQTVRTRIPVGANPRGVAIVDERAYVVNTLDGTLAVIDTTSDTVIDTIRVTTLPLNPMLLRGKVLFHQAGEAILSDGAISCATCHFDGGMDGRTWINFRSGPRNTPALGGLTAPYNWAGEMGELHDTIEDQIRNVMLGDGLIADAEYDPLVDHVDAGRSADLDALSAYVASLETWPSPYRAADGSLTESAQRGMEIFMSGAPNCSCHTPPQFVDGLTHSLSGTAFSMEVYEAFDTPTLRGLWMSAPYMHDGVALTLEEVLTRTDPVHSVVDDLTEQELADLIAFLLSF